MDVLLSRCCPAVRSGLKTKKKDRALSLARLGKSMYGLILHSLPSGMRTNGSIYSVFLFCIGAFCVGQPAFGVVPLPPIRPDISIATGVAVGTVKVDPSASDTEAILLGKDKTRTYKIGGFPTSITAHMDITRWLTVNYGGQMIFDLGNRQLLSAGGELGASWHLYGGSRDVVYGTEDLSISYRNAYNVSLVTHLLGSQYSSKVLGADFKGTVMEVRMGMEYRQDLSRRFSIGSDILTTVYALSASTPGIDPRMTVVMGFVRYSYE